MGVTMPSQRTPFYNVHLEHNAKLVDFFGFVMPVQYRSMIEEHRRVRSTVGMFDLSHMGEIEVRGDGALDFVQRVTTNDASRLALHQVQYTAMCYPDGGLVDDLLVYRLFDHFLLVVNASNIEKDFTWLMEQADEGVEVRDRSSEIALLAIQGPRAEDVMAALTEADLTQLGYYWSIQSRVAGEDVLFSRTGYTGEDGFEIYLRPEQAERLWRAVRKAGEKFDIEPVGLGARDTLRLEMKYMLYGNDIDRSTTPLEAGLGWIVKLNKGDFIGREALIEQKKAGIQRKLAAFEMTERAVPRPHYDIQVNGRSVGKVTSGTFSPSLEKGIGLGYVPIEHSKVEGEIEINIRGRVVSAIIIKPPFYKGGTHR